MAHTPFFQNLRRLASVARASAVTGPKVSPPSITFTAAPGFALTGSAFFPKSEIRRNSIGADAPVSRQIATSATCGNRVEGGT